MQLPGSKKMTCKNCSFQFGFSFMKLTAGLVFPLRFFAFICHCHLSFMPQGMMLEMMYFCAELVQLLFSRSDSEVGVQRYGIKKNTLGL